MPFSTGNSTIGSKKTRKLPKASPLVVAFEMQVRGHHPDYVRNFANIWAEKEIAGRFHFLVTPQFRELHESTYCHVRDLAPDWISISTIDESEQPKPGSGELSRHLQGWKAYCRHARELRADHGFLMYFDHFQLPIIVGKRSPCPFSAIYFRPTFHYHTFAKFKPSWKNSLVSLRKTLLLRSFLRTRELARLFCLDPFAADYIIRSFHPRCDVTAMADSFVEFERSSSEEARIRSQLQVQPGRKMFLLLGALDPRKGVKELLNALPLLSADSQSKICLVIIGHGPDDEVAKVSQLVDEMRLKTSVQIVFQTGYIPGDVQPYYWVTDVVLTTYQGHMGSSGAIMRAAFSGKPVLSSDYGLMGEWVYRCKLGQVVDTSNPRAIAEGMENFVADDAARLFDPKESQKLKESNSQDKLAADLRKLVELSADTAKDKPQYMSPLVEQ